MGTRQCRQSGRVVVQGIGVRSACCGILLCLAAAHTRADLLEEEHLLQTEVLNPSFGSVTTVPFGLPRFDDQAGARQLISVNFDYQFLMDMRFEFHGNFTDHPAANYREFSVAWSAVRNGSDFLPDQVQLSHTPFGGWEAEPGDGPRTSRIDGFGIGNGEVVTEAAVLAELTGLTPLMLDSTFTLSTTTDLPPLDGYYTWEPGLFDLYIDRLYVDITMTYGYVAVPEPGSLATIAMLSLVTLIRRRVGSA